MDGHYETRLVRTDDPPGYEAECNCGWSAWQRRRDLVGRLFVEHVRQERGMAA